MRCWLASIRATLCSIYNHMVSSWGVAEALFELGRLRTSLTKYAELLRKFEPFAASSELINGRIAETFYSAAITAAAELGQKTTADQLMADSNRHLESYVGSLPANSFESEVRVASAGIPPVELASLLGDLTRARSAAKGVRERQLKLQPVDAFGREQVAGQLRRLHLSLGWVELQAADYTAALEHFIHVADSRKLMPARNLRQRLEAADDSALLAITLARGRRVEEAQSLADTTLAWEREQQEQMAEYPWRHWSLALALVAAAESTPAKSRALLAEAQAELDRLPAEARAARRSQMLQGLIANARRGAR